MNKYHVYLLQSQKDYGFYIGYTSKKPSERLSQHNSGMVKSTKPRIPFKLIYTESYSDEKEAYKREWYLKHPKGYQEKLEIIRKYGPLA